MKPNLLAKAIAVVLLPEPAGPSITTDLAIIPGPLVL
jgi:hypothetical protein